MTPIEQRALVAEALTAGMVKRRKRAKILLQSPGPDAFTDPFLRETWAALQALGQGGFSIDLVGVARMIRHLRGEPDQRLGRDASRLVALVEDYTHGMHRRLGILRHASLLAALAARLVDDAEAELAGLLVEELDGGADPCLAGQ